MLPVMLFSFFITLVVLMAAFNSSLLTFRKTDLVTAADAAAYSGGVQAARSLNFMAYTNRAMVQNTIAVGYLVSFISYARYLGDFLNEVSSPRQFLAKVLKNNVESMTSSQMSAMETIGDRYPNGAGRNGGPPPESDTTTSQADRNGYHALGSTFKEVFSKSKKGIGTALKTAVKTVGYSTVGPTDMLNTFYSATQVATYAATADVMDSTMAAVAQSYDEKIQVTHSTSSDFPKWVIPMRPGLDSPPGVNTAFNKLGSYNSQTVNVSPFGALNKVPGLKNMVKAVGAPIQFLTNALGWTKANVEADENDFNLGVMQLMVRGSMTPHDAWWILWSRSWRFCLPTIICMAPIFPWQTAADKWGATKLFMAARPSHKNEPNEDDSGRDSGGNGAGGSSETNNDGNDGDGPGNNRGSGDNASARDVPSSSDVAAYAANEAGAARRSRGSGSDAYQAGRRPERLVAAAEVARRHCAHGSRRSAHGIGGTGVWIVGSTDCAREPGRARRATYRPGARGGARLVQVAEGLPDYSPEDSPPNAKDLKKRFGAVRRNSIAEQANHWMKNSRNVVRKTFSGGYRNRVNRMRKGLSGVGKAAGQGLTKKLRSGLNAASEGAFKFDQTIKKFKILPRNGSLTYGTDWLASDILSNGLFDGLPTIIAKFIATFIPVIPGDIGDLRYHLEPLAVGEASAKEFYKPYQGVPLYFTLAEMPFSNLRPDMKIDVTLTRPGGASGLLGALGFKGQTDADMKAAASAELYYYRQPDDDQNEYFRPVESGPLLPLMTFLWETPALKRLSNWYGRTQVATAFWEGTVPKILDAPDDYAEFDNAFNPFWEVRLTGVEG